MTQLSDSEVADVVRRAGFGHPEIHTAIATALAASDGLAHYDHVVFPGPVADYRGLWGVDLCEHPDLIGVDLANPWRAAQAAHDLTLEHSGFGWCPAWRTGAFYPFLDRAAVAASMRPVPPRYAPPVALAGHVRAAANRNLTRGAVHNAIQNRPSRRA